MSVEKVSKVHPGTVAPTLREKAKKAGKRADTALKIAGLFAGIARKAGDVAEQFHKIPLGAAIGLKASKMPDIIRGFVSIKKAAEDVQQVFSKTGKPLERFQASCMFLLHLNSVVKALASSLKFLQAVGAVGLKAIKWIPIFNIVSYVVGFISLGLASFSVHKSRKLLSEFEEISKRFNEARSDHDKALILEQAIVLIEKDGIEPLREELRLSKAARATILARIERLRESNIPSREENRAQAIADMHEAFIILKDRMHVQLGYKSADLAISVAETVAETFMLTPLAPIGIGILLTTSVCSLVTFGGRTYFINKNPFDMRSQSKASQLLDRARRGLEHVRQAIHVSTVAKHRLPSR
jgi:hypothetical protein